MVAARGRGVAAWVLLRIVFSAGAIAEEQQESCGSSADCAAPRGVCMGGVCHCIDGYSGAACDVPPDRCLYPVPVRCGTGSRCVDGECVRPDVCDEVACGEHGSCEHGVCVCVGGYDGPGCSDVDECASQPCRNGGTCHHSADVRGEEHPAHEQLRAAWVGRHVCACASGYAGVECQCLHCGDHGTCQFDGRCICDAGFVGAQCEIDIDECASVPCKNDGECEDLDDAYRCTCLQGFTGERCQTDVDECASQPCGQNGKCIDEVDGYSCACRGDFIGEHCTVECSCGENGEQRNIAAAREAGHCSAGDCFCTGKNSVGEYCEESCGDHGTSDGRRCACSEDWIGERCDTQCLCGEHGEQVDIAAARRVDDCSAGRCACSGDYIGPKCDIECGCGANGKQSGIVSARAAGSCDAGSCSCTGDWIGDLCDTECQCGAHGTQVGIAAARAAGSCDAGSCSCTDDWIGDICDTECQCGAHGTQVGIAAARAAGSCDAGSCACQGEYIGPQCDIQCGCGEHGRQIGITEARAAGSCGAGSCACENNWTGDLCDVPPSACLSEPCLNGGTCETLAAAQVGADGRAYRCSCSRGWSGPDCQTHVCDANPCGNAGKCVDADDEAVKKGRDFSCICVKGWVGKSNQLPAERAMFVCVSFHAILAVASSKCFSYLLSAPVRTYSPACTAWSTLS